MTRDPARERRVAQLLAARFELVQFLGEGGFASVYQVVNRRLGRIEALKVLHPGHTDEADFARRFEQEARVAASLDHPNVVKIFDYGQAEELFWFTMQFVGGPTLNQELRQTRTFPPDVAVRIAVAVLDALDYSHRRGVIHRDVKPENIILDEERRPYLMDFGIAKSEASLVRTQTGTVLGSPAYIAPEQLTGAVVDGRADLFALAVTLYRMLTGAFPFYDEDVFRMATKRLTMPPRPMSAVWPEADPRLESVVMRALEREPDRRFATAGQMRDVLAAYLAGTPEAAPAISAPAAEAAPPGPTPVSAAAPLPLVSDAMPTVRTEPPRPVEAPRRRRAPIALTSLVLAAVVAGILLVTLRRGPQSAPAAPRKDSPAERPTAAAVAVPLEPSPLPVTPAALPTAAPSPAARQKPTSLRPTAEPAPARPQVRLGAQPEKVYEVTADVSPEIAREFGDRPVGLAIVIAPDGTVRSARVISKLCPECDRAATEAVLKWKYAAPVDTQGKPMELPLKVVVMIPSQVP